nr:MAG TPA: hypothetical protein [Caudoviricetes sp.]
MNPRMVLSIKCFQGIRIKPDSATCTDFIQPP